MSMIKVGASSVKCLPRSKGHLFCSKGIYHLVIRSGAQSDRADSMELIGDEADGAVRGVGHRRGSMVDS